MSRFIRVLLVFIVALILPSMAFGGVNPFEKTPAKTNAPSVVPTGVNSVTEPVSEPQPVKMALYSGPVYHVFFHGLIAFPYLAFSPRAHGALDTDCITAPEFRKALEQLYKNNFVLVDIHSTYEVVSENGKTVVRDKKLILPEGKKPLVMSVDDLVYDPKKMGLGMVDKIILDDEGNFATYTRMSSGQVVIAEDNEIIPILENFITEHPDFSFQGARATLALTGWVGVLGYRIDRRSPDQQAEIEAVRPIIKRLREKGWTFACHGYGHYHASQLTPAQFATDVDHWRTEIEPVVGPTDIYVYPYGDKAPDGSPNYQILVNNGFRMMCGVGLRPYWKDNGQTILMDRASIDGFTLQHQHQKLLPLFDTTQVFDPESRLLL